MTLETRRSTTRVAGSAPTLAALSLESAKRHAYKSGRSDHAITRRSRGGRRRFLALLVVLTLILVISVTSSRAERNAAQHAGHVPGTAVTLTLAVDGASNAAAISDDLAYEHFMRALAAASPELQYNMLRDVLDEHDRDAVTNVLGSIGGEPSAIAKKRTASMGNGPQRRLEEMRIVHARTQIEGVLSFDGRLKFASHVLNRVKSRIRVYRGSVPQESVQ